MCIIYYKIVKCIKYVSHKVQEDPEMPREAHSGAGRHGEARGGTRRCGEAREGAGRHGKARRARKALNRRAEAWAQGNKGLVWWRP